jgi:tetratricopeptide (TPR) repeat protein
MTPRFRVTVVAGALLAACLVVSMFALARINQIRYGATLEEVLYIPSAKLVKRLSLGYTGLAADIYWTRAVQYFGRKHLQKAEHYDLLYPLLDMTVSLDPDLMPAYEFGGFFLAQPPPEGAGQPEKAVELLERGIREHPDAWRLYFNLGFIHFMDREDYAAAADAFERGSQRPGAHQWLKIMAAMMAQQGGHAQKAKALWAGIYETTQDQLIRDNAANHLRAIQSDEAVTQLEQIVADYQARSGAAPSSWQPLIAAGILRGIPVDPTGRPYRLISGRVEVDDPKALPYIQKGLPPGWVPSVFGKPQ